MLNRKNPRDWFIAILLIIASILILRPVRNYLERIIDRPIAVRDPVSGFTLSESGFSGLAVPFFGMHYAKKSQHEQFVFESETYFPTRNHSAVIFLDTPNRNRYSVQETLLEVDSNGRTTSTRLTITDSLTGKEVASRTLRKGQVEDQTGWVGDHALKFVSLTLVPQPSLRSPFRYWSEVKEYGLLSTSDLSVTDGTRFQPSSEFNRFQSVEKTCPSGFKVKRHGSPGALSLDSPKWRFLPANVMDGAFCSNGYVVVISSIFPGSPRVDVLRLDGSHLGTLELGIPGDLLSQHANLWLIENGRIEGKTAEFELNYARPDKVSGVFVWTAFQRTKARITIPEIN